MSEITLDYRLTLDDLMDFGALNLKVANKRMMMLYGILIILNLVLAFFDRDIFFLFLSVGWIALAFIIPAVNKKKVKKVYSKSYLLSHDIHAEFFEDHIVIKMIPNENSKAEGETHYPLETIINITESDDNFFFFINPIEGIVIPKRAMSAEDRKKLFNLISNRFSDKFNRVNIRKAMREDKSNTDKRG